LLATAGACALLAGCTADGHYPSLAKRPAELVAEGRIARSALPVTPLPAPIEGLTRPLPADLPGRIAVLADEAGSARAKFAEARADATRAVGVAAGAGRGSDAWTAATVAVAELSSARSRTAVPLAELNELYVAQRVDGGDGQTIAAVRDQVTAWVADEDAVLADLVGRLGS